MLKVEVNKNNGFCMVEANGPLPEIVRDLLMVIGSIGGSLDKKKTIHSVSAMKIC